MASKKKSNVYGCKVKPGQPRKGCGGGATVVELERLKKRIDRASATADEAKRIAQKAAVDAATAKDPYAQRPGESDHDYLGRIADMKKPAKGRKK